MNLATVLRNQFTQMTTWFHNALITNVILDYLDLETSDIQENVKTMQALIESGRVKSQYEFITSKERGYVYYVDGIKVLTIWDPKIEITMNTTDESTEIKESPLSYCGLRCWFQRHVDKQTKPETVQ